MAAVVTGATLFGLPVGTTVCRAADKATASPVAQLIEQLGSPHYATRERAATELSQLGLKAFDALHDAQADKDIEIAERARYILYSMNMVFARTGDTSDVKRLLKDYSRQSEAQRGNRMAQLAALDNATGLDALCRLVRYEMSLKLAKEGALLVMSNTEFASEDQRAALRQAVAEQVGESQRPGALWLATYVRTLHEPAMQVEAWDELIDSERQLLVLHGEDAPTTSKIVRDLYRWQAEYLQKLDRQEEATDAVRQMIAHSDGSREQIVEMIDWLMQRKAWAVVDEIAAKHATQFATDELLLYRLAEAQAERGEKDLAEQTADKAFAIAPTESQRHLLVAYQLQDRGRFVWSEREYRNVIKTVPLISREGVEARSMLSEMLHDLQRDKDAAESLNDLVKAVESDGAVADNINSLSLRRSTEELQSRKYFFDALDHLAKNETAAAKVALEKGADANSEDADLLIIMHRFPGDEAWKEKTRELVSTSAADFKNQAEEWQKRIELSDNEPELAQFKAIQAMYCNQYAWLVGNTNGDLQEAIRMSKRSLEIRPEAAGYMDTLAHCYFHAGELENAVKWQSKAVKLEPHSGLIVRALAKFETALAERTEKKP